MSKNRTPGAACAMDETKRSFIEDVLDEADFPQGRALVWNARTELRELRQRAATLEKLMRDIAAALSPSAEEGRHAS